MCVWTGFHLSKIQIYSPKDRREESDYVRGKKVAQKGKALETLHAIYEPVYGWNIANKNKRDWQAIYLSEPLKAAPTEN